MKLNILIVEDSRDVCLILTSILQSLGHYVVAAESIATARLCLADAKFDLIISDNQLLDGRGIDLLNELAESRPEMQRMLMSGSDDPGGHTAAFMLKPFSLARVRARIESMFQTTPP